MWSKRCVNAQRPKVTPNASAGLCIKFYLSFVLKAYRGLKSCTALTLTFFRGVDLIVISGHQWSCSEWSCSTSQSIVSALCKGVSTKYLAAATLIKPIWKGAFFWKKGDRYALQSPFIYLFLQEGGRGCGSTSEGLGINQSHLQAQKTWHEEQKIKRLRQNCASFHRQ